MMFSDPSGLTGQGQPTKGVTMTETTQRPVAIVTGSGTGVGAAAALMLAQHGYSDEDIINLQISGAVF